MILRDALRLSCRVARDKLAAFDADGGLTSGLERGRIGGNHHNDPERVTLAGNSIRLSLRLSYATLWTAMHSLNHFSPQTCDRLSPQIWPFDRHRNSSILVAALDPVSESFVAFARRFHSPRYSTAFQPYTVLGWDARRTP